MKRSKRLDKLSPYLFAELDRKKAEKIKEGVEVIDLGVGDPVEPTAPFVVEAMKRAVEDPKHHRYPPYEGTEKFREAVSKFYNRRYGVSLDSEKEVIALIGSKEGIAHLCMAILDEKDILLVPDPGYPVYKTGAYFAGADVYVMPLLKENDFLPDFTKIPNDILKRAKMMFLNYPNNPTSALANLDFYKEAVEFAKRYDIIIASDNSYGEIYFGDVPPPSIMSVPGAIEVAVEFYSLSKPYNMTGWRIAALVGNPFVVDALATFKKNIDSGTFTAIQEVSSIALTEGDQFVENMRRIYKRRLESILSGLDALGVNVYPTGGAFYVWSEMPKGFSSVEFSSKLLDELGILVSPGVGFGEYGEGYFRISLTASDKDIEKASYRMKRYKVGI